MAQASKMSNLKIAPHNLLTTLENAGKNPGDIKVAIIPFTMTVNLNKAAGIKLYTIRVIDGNASLLQSCATNPTMYYDVQQASQLNGVFTAVAQNLANLQIAK